ncbi:calcineurin-like phosphoesterase [Colletotrichum tofieldiae]|uniref:Rhamnogalacturonate lyase C n=1 Tax=Colletotrichum liriopes TaxID=708192 RepID=A0AA37LXM3_9PEZI|nr:putative rhamnogalacturonate lyase C [Colletotrichum liriopes]GKT66813.1 calcineurin-like phosphoesterase [Colletotrichum tofieldiae]GKT71881.1 calcineurin-like phosphoesterase [Colletotrichum tofieldiae]GKT94935.1 calcineurin-like phosphoesterase [Colletotrichum tofieldiae]
MPSAAGTMDYSGSSPPTRRQRRQPVLRRTRFVCVSDTHNTTVKLPKGDVLIHAGDLTNQGSYSEVRGRACLCQRPGAGSFLVAGSASYRSGAMWEAFGQR